MRKVIVRGEANDTVYLDELKNEVPVFATKAGKFVGMVVLEYPPASCVPRGWILRTGGEYSAYGHSDTLKECIQGGRNCGYEFFVED